MDDIFSLELSLNMFALLTVERSLLYFISNVIWDRYFSTIFLNDHVRGVFRTQLNV